MNTITIDPSLSCTAVVVNDHKLVFANSNIMLTKTGDMVKWFKACEPFVEFHAINYKMFEKFEDNEMYKLEAYDEITQSINDEILKYIDTTKDIQVYMEGYSYSSSAGPLIDLVTFSTLLRKKMKLLSSYVTILPPSKLKLEACKFTYPPIIKGKKVKKEEYRNNEGMAGGKFTKREIYLSLVENNNLNCEWVKFLRDQKDTILSMKNVCKPVEDINDAKIMYEIFKN